MKIAIDLRPLMGGKISGVEIYILSMLEALFEEDKENQYVLWTNAFKKPTLTSLPALPSNVRLHHTYFPNKVFNFFLSLLRWPKLNWLVGGADVFWIPDPRPAPVSRKCRKMVTFHDLSFEEFKDSFNSKTRLWHKLLRPRREAQEASRIIAVSHFTRNKLTTIYGLPSSKVTVIHEAAPTPKASAILPDFEGVRKKYNLPKRYFLCLSTLEPRKNIAGVIASYLDFKKETGSKTALVIAGREHPSIFSDAALPVFGAMFKKDSSIHLTGFIEEEDKILLYANAVAFLYPSFYEGFGLPILEAMQAGAPVITSKTASMPEVAGAAAILVNPKSPEELTQAMGRLDSNETLRQELIQKGYAQADTFSWRKAAIEFLKLTK